MIGHNKDDPILIKKLQQGDGLYENRKRILGWILDGIARSIVLLHEKTKEILAELKNIGRQQNIPLQRYQKILGRLRRVVVGIPTGNILLTPLYKVLRTSPDIVHLNNDVKLPLRDW